MQMQCLPSNSVSKQEGINTLKVEVFFNTYGKAISPYSEIYIIISIKEK